MRRNQAHRSASLLVAGIGLMLAGCEKTGEPAKTAAPGKPEKAAKVPEQASEGVKPMLGLPQMPVPPDNAMTAAKVELGKLLYFDTRLSKSKTISCATCHDPKLGWAEREATSKGIHEQKGDRNAPSIINTAYLEVMFWDGRAKSLEEQALGPIENPIEMGQNMDTVVKELGAIPEYKRRFSEVFGTDITKEAVGKAIAAFERTVLSGDSPYDRFKAGDQNALNDAQKRGLEVFTSKASCETCHTPPIFSNSKFYNAGVGMDKPKPDIGRKKVTNKESDMGRFRVPALREVANTAPYFHDGSAKTLEEAVELMASGGKDNPNLDAMMKAVRAASLTKQDKADLVEFLKALSGKYPIIEPPKLP
jgi:cytochrome c peroxidase